MKRNRSIKVLTVILIVVVAAVFGSIGYFVLHGNLNVVNTSYELVSTPNIPVNDVHDSKNTTDSVTIKTKPTPPTLVLDVCANIEGIQTTVPVGMHLSGSTCATILPTTTNPVEDVCTNIPGIQITIPVGMILQFGLCTTYPAAPPVTPTPTIDPQLAIQKAKYVQACNILHNFVTTEGNHDYIKPLENISNPYICYATYSNNLAKLMNSFSGMDNRRIQDVLKSASLVLQ